MSQIIFCVLTIARQINGELVFIKTEKAFKKASKADEHVKTLNKGYREGDKYKPMKFSSEFGDIECFCVAGGFDLEVED